MTQRQKRYLRGFTNDLKAVILVGQKGITPALLKELDGALAHHELVKIKIAHSDRASRSATIEQIRESSGGQLVQTIGNVACLFRRSARDPKFELPR